MFAHGMTADVFTVFSFFNHALRILLLSTKTAFFQKTLEGDADGEKKIRDKGK